MSTSRNQSTETLNPNSRIVYKGKSLPAEAIDFPHQIESVPDCHPTRSSLTSAPTQRPQSLNDSFFQSPNTSTSAQSAAVPNLSQFTIHNSLFLVPGELTLILGNPGTGKSLLAIDLAARLSRAEPLPFHHSSFSIHNSSRPASSLLLSLEDSPQTIQSRLLSAHADLHRLHHIPDDLDLVPPDHGLPRSWIRQDKEPKPSTLIKRLQEFLPEVDNFRLLILDPLPAFLGTLDCPSQSAVRKTLRPLFKLAQQKNFAILGISHLNKYTHSTDLLHRSAGSFAYTALARTVFLLTYDALTHHPDRRILVPLKHNVGRQRCAYAFSITSELPAPCGDQNPLPPRSADETLSQVKNPESKIEHSDAAAHIKWESDPISDHPLLKRHCTPPAAPQMDFFELSQLESAIEFLTTMLQKGPVATGKIQNEAYSLGLARRTLHRARSELKVRARHGGFTNRWYLTLPSHDLSKL